MLGRVARRRDAEGGQAEIVDDRRQIVGHVPGVCVPSLRIASGCMQHQLVELCWHTSNHRARCGYVVIHPLVRHSERTVTGERGGPGEEFVDENADRVHIAARVGVPGADLFGRQVGRRAQNDAGGGDLGLGHRANQSEVGDLDFSAVGDQHVLGLDVAVYETGRVRNRQSPEDGCEYGGDGVRRHRAALA